MLQAWMMVPMCWTLLFWWLLQVLPSETRAFSTVAPSDASARKWRRRRGVFDTVQPRHRDSSVPTAIGIVQRGEKSDDGSEAAVSRVPLLALLDDDESVKDSQQKSPAVSMSSSIAAAARIPQADELKGTPTLTLDETAVTTTTISNTNNKKNTILFLLWTIAMLSSLDRVAMSVAIVPIALESSWWTDSIKGTVSSFFSLGYGIGIVPAGLILANASPKVVMGAGMVIWSVATILTPLGVDATMVDDASGSLLLLCGLRMAVGLGESIVIPTVQRTLSVWTDASEKSRALAFIFSGFATGTVLAYLASPILMESSGSWRSLFQVYGSIGLLLVVPWCWLAQDSPVTTTAVKGREVEKEKDVPQSGLALFTNAPWRDFAQSPGVWGMLLAHSAKNWGLYNNLAWTPTFYAEQYGLTVADSAWLSVLPSIAGAVGGGVAGVAADAWLMSPRTTPRSVEEVTRLRKFVQGIAFLGPAAALAMLAYDIPEKAITAQWFLMITVGLQSFHSAGFEAGNQEKAGPKWSGLLYSVTSLPAVFCKSA
jgi:MFS transporter, ACS family, solute carrier family 17 (sodium-dependent inorganic phosphate cotransporter), other